MNIKTQIDTSGNSKTISRFPILIYFKIVHRKCVTCSYAQGHDNNQKMCRVMVCHDPYKGRCLREDEIYEMRAFDGTTCRENHWCMEGRCVFNNNKGKEMELLAQLYNLRCYYNHIPTVGAAILVFFEINLKYD